MYKHYQHTATVSRLTYSGWKGTRSATGDVYKGQLKSSADEVGDVGRGALGKVHRFQTDINADIQQSDTLTIASKAYTVKGVTKHDGIRIKFLRAVVILDPWLN